MYISSTEKDGFELKLYFLEECIPLLDTFDYDDKAQEQELIDNVESGEWLYFCAKVTACKEGVELASDYLGACVYEGETDFKASGYYEDMCNIAISEAKEVIKNLTK